MFSCDPLSQDCATDNEACYLFDGGGVCLQYGTAAVGDACEFTNSCAEGGQCLGSPGAYRALCGTIDEMWGDDGMDALTWPLCCGADCDGATLPCQGASEMCWGIGDGMGGMISDAGVCILDTEASQPDAPMPWTCDCDSASSEKCAFD